VYDPLGTSGLREGLVMPMLKRLVATALVALCLVSWAGCAPSVGRQPADTDPKLSQSTFIEEGNLVALIVGARVTRLREKKPYIPLEIAVVNKGLPGLSFTAESFTLVDQEGNRYSTVGFDELREGYGNIDLDRRLGEVPPVVRGTRQGYNELPSTLTGSFDKPITRKVFLPKFGYINDIIYFPTPAAGVRGRKFELFLDAPELEDPVFVRFEVQR
jgi:hypothetical protein